MTEPQIIRCERGEHDFKTISDVEYSGYDAVIKWCLECGTVGFYTVFDGRCRGEDYLVPRHLEEQ